MVDASVSRPATGPMAPFAQKAFLVLWLATVASNIGTWMHDVGAAWLMTELAPSPFMVAAVQAATTLPIFLFALLAGAIADVVDKRKLLIWINVAMGLAALAMAVLVHFSLITPITLLLFTFLFGTGAAFIAPAWQAIVPKLVDRENLSSAIALNSMGINISRAIGPALAGFLIVSAGIAAPFFANALSVMGIVAALIWWRMERGKETGLPAERIGGAMTAGLRYAWNSPELKVTLKRAAAFFLFASAFWAMLPLVTRRILDGGPTLYGIMLAAVGTGAVAGALLLPMIKKRLDSDQIVAMGTVGTAITLVTMALVPNQIAGVAVAAVAGLSWISVLSSLNVSAQTALPDWVRARGLSVFLTVFFGCMSIGSLIWGQVADHWDIPTALLVAAAGALIMVPVSRNAKLHRGEGLDLSPSMHWPEPILVGETEPDGPVMIQIVYQVPSDNETEFLSSMQKLVSSRKRGGGYHWSLMLDAAEPGQYHESWWEASWVAHQRQHQRVSKEDQKLQEQIAKLLVKGSVPKVRHLIAGKHQ